MRLRFNVLSIDYVRVINCFYDYDYITFSVTFFIYLFIFSRTNVEKRLLDGF